MRKIKCVNPWKRQAQRVYQVDGLATALFANGGGQGGKTGLYLVNNMDEYMIRRLTPRECERLQGFPDDWTKYGKDDELISDTQRYKCCGNAVTTFVVRDIINEMFGGNK